MKKIAIGFVILFFLGSHCRFLESPKKSKLPEMLLFIYCWSSSRDCNSSGQVTRPSVFYYSNSTQTLVQNSQVNIGKPTLDGSGPCLFSSDSPLPDGLALDSATGSISGVPTKLTPLSVHIIKASCLAGEISTSLTLKVISYTCSVSSAPMELNSFSFNSASTGLNQTYTGAISGQNISVQLPYGILSTAPPTFITTGIGVTVNGTEQVSGTTKNDFTNPIVYSVRNLDGCTKDYLVTVFATTPISDSGQTLCYDNTTSVACTGTGGSFPGQDGDYVNVPNAISLSASPTTNAGYPSDYIVKDSLTGIVWKACSEGQSGATCSTGSATAMDWYTAGSTCSALNTTNSGAGFAGLKTWRLPYASEMLSIVDQGASNPTINLTRFPATPATTYWAKEDFANDSTKAWAGIFTSANTSYHDKTYTGYRVRCVAGSSMPSKSFVDNSDGTISDRLTGLAWQKCQMGRSGTNCTIGSTTAFDWASALQSCNSYGLLGKTWRLPNAREMDSIVDRSIYNPALSATNFPLSNQMWTATTSTANLTYAHYLHTAGGFTLQGGKTTPSLYIRCVSGP